MFSIPYKLWVGNQIYPERDEPRLEKIEQLMARLGGVIVPWFRPNAAQFKWIIPDVRTYAKEVSRLPISEMPAYSRQIGESLRRNGFEKKWIVRSFALVREAARRTVKLRHRDVQLIGGLVLLGGMVAEMETGEGKTLTATLPACTLAMAGVPVHIITVNDYLAQRDCEWMGPIYRALGLRVGVIVHGMDPAARRAAYRCHVTYCTNKEVAFDYLRDRIVLWDRPSAVRMQLERLYGDHARVNRLTMRGLRYAIVDEVDSVLVDEARTPLIISAEEEGFYSAEIYERALAAAKKMTRGKDFVITSERAIELTPRGKLKIGGDTWKGLPDKITVLQREELVRQALVALHLFFPDKHYLIKDGKVQIIDEYTGRIMADRSWERGLHQLIEAKEGCDITKQKETRARISYQRFFRRYLGLAGMTGTAREVAGELWSIYRLQVVNIPTHRPIKRKFLPDRYHLNADHKWIAIVRTIADIHRRGRPILVGTRSVEASEHLSRLLTEAGLPHQVLNARQDQQEAQIIAQAGKPGRITVATNMAGRGTDIKLAKGIAQRGGLHVIATERHDARRIDRQLFGRCGRQGDPGTCEAIISFDDDLIDVHTSNLFRQTGSVLSRFSGRTLHALVGRFLCFWAQQRAERIYARMRRDLLKLDEQTGDSLAFTGRME